MATKYWLGIADAVAQVATGSIDSVDGTPANNTFTVTIGGVAISAVGDTDVATTATNLRASLNGSTHPYFAGITWSGSAGDIIGTADVAGVPFVAALTETGAGTGTVTDFAATVASESPNSWGVAENWSDGVVPVDTDTVYLRENAVNICWDLAQSAVELVELFIEKTYTGKIGLDRSGFAITADGDTLHATIKPEYRDTYLNIDIDALEIGKHPGQGNATGSPRIKINNSNTGASTTTVFATANTPSEPTLTAVRLLVVSATADFFIRGGSVGFAVDEAAETATIGDVYVDGLPPKVFVGAGVTMTSFIQNGGVNQIEAAATIATVTVKDGTLTIEGDFTITTFTQNGGIVYDNHTASGNAITTANLNDGQLITTRSSKARTYSVVNMGVGGSLEADGANLTITTLNEPSGVYTLAAS